MVINNRSIVAFTLAVVALGSTRAVADDVVAPDGSIIRRTKLESACSVSLDRFCPYLADTPGQTRNQATCLKPYRTSLSTSCRAAVNAAVKSRSTR